MLQLFVDPRRNSVSKIVVCIVLATILSQFTGRGWHNVGSWHFRCIGPDDAIRVLWEMLWTY